MPMTTFGGDGKASVSKKPGHNPMTDEDNIEDVAQSETTFEEEFKEFKGWLEAQVEEADPLPKEEEAEMGELCRVPSEERER